MGNGKVLGGLHGLRTVHSRTAFSAGLYDMLNTGNLEPLELYMEKRENTEEESGRKNGITPTPPTYRVFIHVLITFIIRNKNQYCIYSLPSFKAWGHP